MSLTVLPTATWAFQHPADGLWHADAHDRTQPQMIASAPACHRQPRVAGVEQRPSWQLHAAELCPVCWA